MNLSIPKRPANSQTPENDLSTLATNGNQETAYLLAVNNFSKSVQMFNDTIEALAAAVSTMAEIQDSGVAELHIIAEYFKNKGRDEGLFTPDELESFEAIEEGDQDEM